MQTAMHDCAFEVEDISLFQDYDIYLTKKVHIIIGCSICILYVHGFYEN